jgi:hypothetical protein
MSAASKACCAASKACQPRAPCRDVEEGVGRGRALLLDDSLHWQHCEARRARVVADVHDARQRPRGVGVCLELRQTAAAPECGDVLEGVYRGESLIRVLKGGDALRRRMSVRI